MIHLYYGDGKGKTTAALGLALRAAGSGKKVLFLQFFKSGNSSEMNVLSSIKGIDTVKPELFYGRYKNMTDTQKTEIKRYYTTLFEKTASEADRYDLIVLDEAVSAYRYGLFDRQTLLSFLKSQGQKREIALTGRDPADELIELADYATEMRKIKHPFDKGITARKGIEY